MDWNFLVCFEGSLLWSQFIDSKDNLFQEYIMDTPEMFYQHLASFYPVKLTRLSAPSKLGIIAFLHSFEGIVPSSDKLLE